MKRAAHRFIVPTLLGVLLLLVASGVPFPERDPLAQNVENRLARPSLSYPMGTDGFGRDVAARVSAGLRTSLAVSLLAVAIAAIVGIPAGMVGGLAGGRAERVLGRSVDLLLGFPSLLLALIFVIALEPSVPAIALAVAVAQAPRLVRTSMSRASATGVREHVMAARSLGLSRLRIALRHVLPLVRRPLFAELATLVSSAIVVEATLSFLGLGVPAPYPSLGRMLLEGSRQYFEIAPWVTVFPGLAIALTGLFFLLLARALGYARYQGG